MPLYFAYGSNLDAAQMAARCNQPKLVGIAFLKDHRFVFAGVSPNRENMGVGSMRRAENCQLAGVVWDITDDDLRALDAKEGYPKRYSRAQMQVTDLHGKTHVTYVYFKTNESPLNPPCQAYLNQVVQAYDTHGFDSAVLYAAYEEARKSRYG